MKSSVTQIERRFEIPSSQIGIIDGSFEIGRKKDVHLHIVAPHLTLWINVS